MNLEHRPLSRAEVDRTRSIAVKLGGWSPVSSLSLCDEVVRFHDVLAAVHQALSCERFQDALAIVRAETDPAWGNPIDEEGRMEDNNRSEQS